jgi:hypothetical protein
MLVDTDTYEAIEITKRWIATWAFDVETDLQYQHSRIKFFQWLGDRKESTEAYGLPTTYCDAIYHWVNN